MAEPLLDSRARSPQPVIQPLRRDTRTLGMLVVRSASGHIPPLLNPPIHPAWLKSRIRRRFP